MLYRASVRVRAERRTLRRKAQVPVGQKPVPFFGSLMREPRPHEKLKRIRCCIGRWVVHEKSFELTKLFSVNLGRNRHTFWDVGFSLFAASVLAHIFDKCRKFTLFRYAFRKAQGAKAKSVVFAFAKNYRGQDPLFPN